MSKFAIIANLEIAAGRMEEYLPLLMARSTRCLKDEPGTLQFDVLRPRDDDTRLMLYEVYRDEDAFETHFKAPALARHREEAAGMLLNLSGAKCNLLD